VIEDEERLAQALADRYRIEREIGSGGMAKVYLATDIRHDRRVALKVLRSDLAASLGAERFLQEVRVTANLQHPHILPLFDSGEADGFLFFVMPFIQGESLRERLTRERELPVLETARLLRDVVDALAAAHRMGVVHRDIKPENVLISGRHAVVADFGVAKAVREATGLHVLTTMGVALGTPSYMAPEQATGDKNIDHRADIYAVGVMGYELLTGRPPFHGRTGQEILAAQVMEAPQPVTALRPSVPSALEALIMRCLEKTPADRWQSAEEMLPHLEALATPSGGMTPTDLQPVKRAAARFVRRKGMWVAATGVVAVASAIVLLTLSPGPPKASVPRVANPVKVTTALGVEESPSWSPDGEALAYQSDQDGDWDIWVTQLGTSQAVNRTADSPADELHPTWSPDGRWIAFFSERDGGGYFLMPAMGGTARRVAPWPPGEVYPTPAQWSPAGTELAYALGQRSEPWIEILTLVGGENRRLPLPAMPRNNCVADMSWSPDGRMLAYRRALSPIAATAELWITKTSDGESLRLTDGSHWDSGPTWSPDSGELYFVSDRGGSRDLWRLIIGESGSPEGPPQQVTTGIELTHAALDANGQRLAYSKGRPVRNVFRAPLLADRPATWADVTQLTYDEADFESIDAGHNGQLLLSSDRSGNWDIYLLPAEGGDLQPLTTDPALDAGPRWKPDGSEVAFYSTRSGHRQLWIMPVGGGPPRQLTHGEAENWFPAWSPAGLEVVIEAGIGLSIVTVGDGAHRRLTDYGGDIFPDWSPDGRWVAFASTRDRGWGLWLIPAAGGEPERLTEREGRTPRWSTDGEQIYFLGQGESKDTVWALSLAGREVRPVTAFTGRLGELGGSGLATDGRFIYFTWQESRGDIWVADILRERGR
jgi:Tol biopolymer transport system component/tRNA A-37 threonylcarbamoyl transferase component Bud32